MAEVKRPELRAGPRGSEDAPGRLRRDVPLLRLAPLALVALGLAIGYAFGLHDYFSLASLQTYRSSLDGFVAQNPFATAAAYVAIYVAAVALSFPGASFLTIAGGFIFGWRAGTALAWIGATIGATFIFLAARTALGHVLAERAGPRLQRLCSGFREEGFSYLLFLRLVPLFPFWIVNLAAGLFGMGLTAYVGATALGILPGSFVFSYFGEGLRSALESEGSPLTAELFVALALLGILALVPAIVRRWRRGSERSAGAPR
jgi:uncharacterized membrane protein YdjX (TVP38/TMEM64 family)